MVTLQDFNQNVFHNWYYYYYIAIAQCAQYKKKCPHYTYKNTHTHFFITVCHFFFCQFGLNQFFALCVSQCFKLFLLSFLLSLIIGGFVICKLFVFEFMLNGINNNNKNCVALKANHNKKSERDRKGVNWRWWGVRFLRS